MSNGNLISSSLQVEQDALTARFGGGSNRGEGHGNDDNDMDVSTNILPYLFTK